MKKSAFLKIGVVITLALFCLQEKALASMSIERPDETPPFGAYADELIAAIERNAMVNPSLPQSRTDAGGISVAVWPFRTRYLPVPQAMAKDWNEKLVAALLRRKPEYLRVLTRRELGKRLSETPAGNAGVSFLIIATILPTEKGAGLSYKVIDLYTGAIVATTEHRRFSLDFSLDPGEEPKVR